MITTNPDNFLWVEKYRPKRISDCILTDKVRKQLQPMIDKGELQNLMLIGSAGVGKTSASKALCEELGIDYLIINCSENGNIDSIRTTVRTFASSVSLMGGFKCVIFDESDGMTHACFHGGQKVTTVENGKEVDVKIQDLVDVGEKQFLTYNHETGEEITTTGHAFYNGDKDVFKYTFDDGSEVYCTEDHIFFDKFGNEVTLDIGVEVISRRD